MPTELPAMALLGLTDPDDGDWAKLRGLQYASLARSAIAKVSIQTVAALATAALFIGTVPIVAIVAWLAALTGSLYHSHRADAALIDADRRRVTPEEIKAQTITSIVNALVWVVPIACFGLFGTTEVQIKFWSVLAMLMTASAILLTAVPMGTLMFAGIVGLAAITYFLFNGEYDMAVVSSALVCTIVVGSLESARRFLATKVAQAGMLEKDEVVSLLLREFEEGEADWLWQIDTSRRVRAVSPRFAFALGKDPKDVDGKPFIQLIAALHGNPASFPQACMTWPSV
jgi:PAS domain-containing protein